MNVRYYISVRFFDFFLRMGAEANLEIVTLCLRLSLVNVMGRGKREEVKGVKKINFSVT